MTEQYGPSEQDPETAFILACLQSRIHDQALDKARTITDSQALNWDLVAKIAHAQWLAPLIYSVIREEGLLPAMLEEEFRAFYIENGLHNARQFDHVGKLITAFAGAGIPLLVLKGAALAETVYGNIALRRMIDVDILVHRNNVEKSLKLLAGLDYATVDPETHPGMITQYENEVMLVRSQGFKMPLELHWSLLDSPHYQNKVEMDWFWQTAERARIGNSQGLVLGLEALIIHLCSHLMLHHQGRGLMWLHDIAELLGQNQEAINWDALLTKAQTFDLVLSVQQVVKDVNVKWDIQLGPEVLDKINKIRPSARERQVVNWLTVGERPVAQRFWVDLATSTGWKQRLRYAWRSMLPSPDYMRQRYQIKNGLFLPLYYPYRWLLGIFSIFGR